MTSGKYTSTSTTPASAGTSSSKASLANLPQIHLNAERSVFETGRAFIRFQLDEVATVHQHFHFTGKENRHPLGKKWLTVGSKGPIISWDEPKLDLGVIQIAGTDQTFTDLNALPALPPKTVPHSY